MAIQDRKVYDFASVGQTQVQYKNQFNTTKDDLPVGIITPIRLGYGNDGIFKMSKDLVTQVRDNFRNMLSTNWGERLMFYDFGASLTELAFELGTEIADMEAIARIKRTTEKYMPFIELQTMESFSEPMNTPQGGMAKIGIRITYMIGGLGPDSYIDEVIIYSAG